MLKNNQMDYFSLHSPLQCKAARMLYLVVTQRDVRNNAVHTLFNIRSVRMLQSDY